MYKLNNLQIYLPDMTNKEIQYIDKIRDKPCVTWMGQVVVSKKYNT